MPLKVREGMFKELPVVWNGVPPALSGHLNAKEEKKPMNITLREEQWKLFSELFIFCMQSILLITDSDEYKSVR